MKLTLDRDALLSAMLRASGIVARRSTIPILANVLLTATDSLTIRATDLDLQAVVTVAADVAAPGSITVPAGTLLDIAKATPEGAEISMTLTDGRLHVTAGRARWKLPTLPARDFPSMAPPEWEWSATMAGSDLADLLGRVAWAMNVDQGRAMLCGARIEVGEGQMIAVATQGRDMAVARTAVTAAAFDGVTIPARACQEIGKFCAGDVTLHLSDSMVWVETAAGSLLAKVIALPYPKWATVAYVEQKASFTTDRKALDGALRRAMIGASFDKNGHSVRLTVGPGGVNVRGRSADHDASDDIDADYEGEEAFFGINCETVSSVLSMLVSDTVKISFTPGGAAPLRFECEGDASVFGISAQQKVA